MGEKQSKSVSEADVQRIQQALTLVRKEDKEALREIFRQFALTANNKSKKYKVTKAHFFQVFHISGPLGDRLFEALDTSKKGQLNYVEFVRGLNILLRASTEEKSQLLFQLADTRRTRSLAKPEFRALLFHLATCFQTSVTFLLTGAGDARDPPAQDEQTVEQAFAMCDVSRSGSISVEQFVNWVLNCQALRWFMEMEFLVRRAVEPQQASSLVVNLYYDRINDSVVPQLPMEVSRMEPILHALAKECIEQYLQISYQDPQYFPDLQNRLAAVQAQVLKMNKQLSMQGNADPETQREQFRTMLVEKQMQSMQVQQHVIDNSNSSSSQAPGAGSEQMFASRYLFSKENVVREKPVGQKTSLPEPTPAPTYKAEPPRQPEPVMAPAPVAQVPAYNPVTYPAPIHVAPAAAPPSILPAITEKEDMHSGRTTPSHSSVHSRTIDSTGLVVSGSQQVKSGTAPALPPRPASRGPSPVSPRRQPGSSPTRAAQYAQQQVTSGSALQATVTRLTGENTQLESQLSDERMRCEVLQKRLLEVDGRRDKELEQLRKQHEAEMESAEQTIKELAAGKLAAEKEKEAAEARAAAAPASAEGSGDSMTDFEAQLQRRLDIARAQWELEAQEKQRLAGDELRKASRQVELDLTAQVKALETQLSELQEELDDQRNTHEQELGDMRRELIAKQTDLADARRELATKQAQILSPSKERARAQQEKERYEKEWEAQRAKIRSEYEEAMATLKLKMDTEIQEQKQKQQDEIIQTEKTLREEFERRIEEQVMAHNKRLINKHKQVRDDERKRYDKRVQEIEEEWMRRLEEVKKSAQP